MELEPKHLTPYLPYSLKLMVGNKKANVAWMSTKKISYCMVDGYGDVEWVKWEGAHNKIKPILRPLDNLTTKEILKLKDYAENTIMAVGDDWPMLWHYLGNWEDKRQVPYWLFELLLEMHIDIFGLIDKGLAIVNDTDYPFCKKDSSERTFQSP